MSTERIAIALEPFTSLPFGQALTRVAEAGYRAIALPATPEAYGWLPASFLERKGADALRRSADAHGLRVLSLRSFTPVSSATVEDDLARQLEAADRLGCRAVHLGLPRPTPGEVASIERMKSFRLRQADRLGRLAERAEGHSAELWLAPEPNAFFEGALELTEFIRLAGRPAARFALYTVHALARGETLDEAVDIGADVLGCVRLADVAGDPPRIEALGRGEAPIAKLLAGLRAVGFDGPFEVDLRGLQGDPLDAARLCLEYLQREMS